jgi:hypothetical protein
MEEERYFYQPDDNSNCRFVPYIMDHISLYPQIQNVAGEQEELTQEEIEERWQAIAKLQKDLRVKWAEVTSDSNIVINTVEDLYI